ncbi:acyl-CoA-binding protein homolog isoform X2 [Episyrphus balteatus]|uniref:acyl-CoA-binding protein homolog isoform X2 n=1 Tax=Episyrphus balteatus TaxID=286459 RepID=UPI002486BAFE|nr:acyl-CoA-binding protein homolog isoform X2 [Episyrphus balteatus]
MDFGTACEKAKAFTKKPSDEIFLEFYGLYKQSTAGDCNIAKPGGIDLKGKAKWDAWNSRKGMSTDAAKAAYIQCYQKYAPTYA